MPKKIKMTTLMNETEEWLEEPLKNYLRREYAKQKRNASEIAVDIGVSKPTVINWLNEFSIHLRPRGRKKTKKRPNKFFSRMSDDDLVEYIQTRYKGLTLGVVKSRDATAYTYLMRRGLRDKLINEEIVEGRRGQGTLKYASDEELTSLVKTVYNGFSILKLENQDASVLGELRSRGLLEDLVEDKVLERLVKPVGFFSNMTDHELIAYTKKHHKGEKITQIERGKKSGSALLLQLRNRDLMDNLVSKGIIKRTIDKKAREKFKLMNDEEFLNHVSQECTGKTRTDIARQHKSIYREMNDRELTDTLEARGVIMNAGQATWGKYTKMTDTELITFIKDNFHGKAPVYFQGKKEIRAYNIAKDRGLLPKLFESGILVHAKPNYTAMSDDELVSFVREKFSGISLSEFQKGNSYLNRLLNKRELRDLLIEEDTLVRLDRSKYGSLTNDEFVELIRENYKGCLLSELQAKDKSAYRGVHQRGLLDKIISDGILTRARASTNVNETYIDFIGEDSAAQAVASLASITEDTGTIADVLFQAYPTRFPSAADLARSLPGAVKRIGHSLQPFSMEKVRGIKEETKSLPKKVQYNLDELLYTILCDEYQTSFNENPRGTMREIRGYTKEKNGIKSLATRVLDHYKAIYNFSIPGHGRMIKHVS
jgi:hypothetical protein